MIPPALRPLYSPSQLERYFTHIRFPTHLRPSTSVLNDLNLALKPAYNTSPSLPTSILSKPSSTGSKDWKPSLEFLTTLQQYQLSAVPWEHLSKFYHPSPTPNTSILTPGSLFNKIVLSSSFSKLTIESPHGDDKALIRCRGAGRGGPCYENNTFFGNVLRSLGYHVYSGGARVYMGDHQWTGW